ncbi:hypothetical protein BSS2_I0612 [Brucella suis bv. 1 str. S2]|uniref:Uncharacterized protein n=2 Tax=Brucella TaxID=234 RepID=A0A0H3G6K5_BRUSU|nr:hypothetical protein BR0631 [Brucella suis 1330]ACU47629.1 hypothetical protein BMI_I630 [Brucella microti CCM 4915]AEK53965.1 hypothetical protein BPI_I667 [Brucella pinnipedialis B2/94]AEU05645.1 hypothetical protein BSVBI22_A0627 [Brucella suis VBI22]AHN46269.1 hypothetical protein BSS2_I0612 [Brucella suis bv. 1 str. S2]CDL76034.1 unnamed protein product [Brucella canis str. Oliveri]
MHHPAGRTKAGKTRLSCWFITLYIIRLSVKSWETLVI